jgi:addiction module HigA family antidote
MLNMPKQKQNPLETNNMRPIHPGEVLREEFLTPYQLTAHALSMALQVPAPRINNIVREKRAITVDAALRLAKFFGNSAEFWMGLKTDFDMAVARQSMQDALDRIREYQPAEAQ